MVSVLASVAIGAPAMAQVPLDTLAESCTGAWCAAVLQNVNSGRLMCSAESTNFAGQTLRVVLYGDSDAFVEVLDPAWRLPEAREVLLQLVFDGQAVVIVATSNRDSLWWNLDDAPESEALLERLSSHHTVEIIPAGAAGRARFSLRGSRDAIRNALMCWAQLRMGGG